MVVGVSFFSSDDVSETVLVEEITTSLSSSSASKALRAARLSSVYLMSVLIISFVFLIIVEYLSKNFCIFGRFERIYSRIFSSDVRAAAKFSESQYNS